jgi:uncharacterized protein YjiS (DUF1127 family)
MSTIALAASLLATGKADRAEGRLGRWVRRQLGYRRALNELKRLDDRDLEDLDLARADFPALAWRHSMGLPPLRRAGC